MRLRRVFPVLVVAGTFVLGGALVMGMAGCGDSQPVVVNPDKGHKPDVVTPADLPPVQPPDSRKPDQYIWPDHGKPDQPRLPDAYVGTPFGCQADSDCFGQKCCPTPWGVKLCSPTCDIK